MHCRALGHHPRSSSTTAVTDRLVTRHPSYWFQRFRRDPTSICTGRRLHHQRRNRLSHNDFPVKELNNSRFQAVLLIAREFVVCGEVPLDRGLIPSRFDFWAKGTAGTVVSSPRAGGRGSCRPESQVHYALSCLQNQIQSRFMISH